MATVTIEVNGKPYAIGCADGQEPRVRELARQFDQTVRDVAADVGQVGDLRLFLMAALLMADELREARDKAVPTDAGDLEVRASEALDAAARRIETLAGGL